MGKLSIFIVLLIFIFVVFGLAKPTVFPSEIQRPFIKIKEKLTLSPEGKCKNNILETYEVELKKAKREAEDLGLKYSFSFAESTEINTDKEIDDLLYIYGMENKKNFVNQRRRPNESIVIVITRTETDASSLVYPTDLFTAALVKGVYYGIAVCDVKGSLRQEPLPAHLNIIDVAVKPKGTIEYKDCYASGKEIQIEIKNIGFRASQESSLDLVITNKKTNMVAHEYHTIVKEIGPSKTNKESVVFSACLDNNITPEVAQTSQTAGEVIIHYTASVTLLHGNEEKTSQVDFEIVDPELDLEMQPVISDAGETVLESYDLRYQIPMHRISAQIINKGFRGSDLALVYKMINSATNVVIKEGTSDIAIGSRKKTTIDLGMFSVLDDKDVKNLLESTSSYSSVTQQQQVMQPTPYRITLELSYSQGKLSVSKDFVSGPSGKSMFTVGAR